MSVGVDGDFDALQSLAVVTSAAAAPNNGSGRRQREPRTCPALRPLANDEKTEVVDSLARDVKEKQLGPPAFSSRAIAASAASLLRLLRLR